MIKKRRRSKASRENEFYLLVKTDSSAIIYNDWYTISELINVAKESGNDINYHTLSSRINSKANSQFRTLDGCVFTKSIIAKENSCRGGSVAYYSDEDFQDWVNTMNLWPVGSLSDNARILQSVEL